MGLTLGAALRLSTRSGARAPGTARPGRAVAFVGAGGKTTSIFRLARELRRPTLVTTTTHLGTWQAQHADKHVIATSIGDLADLGATGVTLVTGPAGLGERLAAVDPKILLALYDTATVEGRDLLIEADGARQKPLKAPGPHEPQVPPFADSVVVVAGMSAVGLLAGDETVHRAALFTAISGLAAEAVITPDSIVRLLADRHGGLQGIPATARRIALLNQADSEALQALSRGMSGPLLEAYDAVVVASMEKGQVHAAYEPCAGIVLAAGAATRYGMPKQLVLWDGQPLVRIAARSALDAGLEPVLVVTGAYAAEVQEVLKDLPVRVVHNSEWQEGQGASVRAGVAALPTESGSAVFLLADQPLVGPDVVRALVEAHASEGACIVAPLVEESRRGNPVLFDRETFSRLQDLRGDAGGKSIFPDFPIHYVPWHDASIARDIDTPEDYRNLLETPR